MWSKDSPKKETKAKEAKRACAEVKKEKETNYVFLMIETLLTN
jgi:hypothetical protein